MSDVTAAQRVKLARAVSRPGAMDYINALFTDLFESSGEDRVQIGVDNTLCEVDTLVKALEKELEEQEKTKDDLSRERETLLAGA